MAAYLTDDEYRARTGTKQDDVALGEQLEAASRMIDAELYRAPGHFAPIASAVYTFAVPYFMSNQLKLTDETGLDYALRTVADDGIVAIRIDGTTSFTCNLADDWVSALPWNAAAFNMPLNELRLSRPPSGPGIWPPYGTVQITGAWGYAETPGPIRELTAHVCRDFRDTISAGAALRIETIGEGAGIQTQTDTWRLWKMVKRRWGNVHDGLRNS